MVVVSTLITMVLINSTYDQLSIEPLVTVGSAILAMVLLSMWSDQGQMLCVRVFLLVIFTSKELPNRRSKSRHGTSINYSNQEYLFFNSLPFGIPSGLFCQRFIINV